MTSEPQPDTRRRPTWLVAGGVVAVVVVVAGGAFAWPRLWRATQAERVTQRQLYTHQISRIEFDTSSGSIRLTPGRAGRVAVERHLRWTAAPPHIEERWSGDTLHIGFGCPEESSCSVDYVVSAPEKVVVEARTAAGDITVHDMLGDLQLSTSAGDVEVTNALGALRARAAAGAVIAHEVRSSRANVETRSGDLELDFASNPAEVEAASSAGDIVVSLPRDSAGDAGYAVRASTDGGTLHIGVRQDAASGRTIDAHSTAGDVDIRYTP